MFISEKFKKKRPLISFEIFPPKKQNGIDAIKDTILQLLEEKPDFISVTCGAGGIGNIDNTGNIAALIKKAGKTESVAHFTCVGTKKLSVKQNLEVLKNNGIDNILALRGDLPKNIEHNITLSDFKYSSDLITEIKTFGGFCIAAAAYPEGHVECENVYKDIYYLKEKQEKGADYFISQLFFDNDYFYRFLDRARSAGITIPITAGVMPIMSRPQIERMIFLCGASLPSPIIRMLYKYENNFEDLRKAGLEQAISQIEDLIHNNADGIHIYTMNHSDIAQTIMSRIL